jgi:hypothetical protein
MYYLLDLAYGSTALVADIAADLQYADGLAALTLKYRDGGDLTIEQALVEPFSIAELEASKGLVTKTDRKVVWSADAGPRPKLGSVFVDDAGVYWTILRIVYREQVNNYEAQTRNLAIAMEPADRATVLRADYTKAEGNVASPQWHPVAADIPARFQPSTEAARIFLGSEYTKTTYRVIFSRPVPIELAGGEYRLLDAQGYRYRVVEYLDQERIDTLPVAIAVKILEGSEYWDASHTSVSASQPSIPTSESFGSSA